jgi:hypothetical protein
VPVTDPALKTMLSGAKLGHGVLMRELRQKVPESKTTHISFE